MEKLDQKYMSAFREIEETIDSTVSFQEISNLIVEKVTCFLEANGASMLILDSGDGGPWSIISNRLVPSVQNNCL